MRKIITNVDVFVMGFLESCRVDCTTPLEPCRASYDAGRRFGKRICKYFL